MDCRGFRADMWPYLKDELNEKKTYSLIEHVNECQACKEELRIQFFISEGFKRLESEKAGYNLLQDFDNKLQASEDFCRKLKFANYITIMGMMLATLFSIGVLVFSLFF